MIVIDASALLDALQQEPLFDNLKMVMEQHELIAPDHLDIECLHALRKLERLGQISQNQALGIIDTLRNIACIKFSVQPIMTEIWSLRQNFTAYDAAYVAIALDTNSKLITHDLKLAKSANNMIEIGNLFGSPAQ